MEVQEIRTSAELREVLEGAMLLVSVTLTGIPFFM